MIRIEVVIVLPSEPPTPEGLGEAKCLLSDIQKMVREFGQDAQLLLSHVDALA